MCHEAVAAADAGARGRPPEAEAGRRHEAFLLARFAAGEGGERERPNPNALVVDKIERLGGRVQASGKEAVVAVFGAEQGEDACAVAAYAAWRSRRRWAARGASPAARLD
jgi:hypothetical protein